MCNFLLRAPTVDPVKKILKNVNNNLSLKREAQVWGSEVCHRVSGCPSPPTLLGLLPAATPWRHRVAEVAAARKEKKETRSLFSSVNYHAMMRSGKGRAGDMSERKIIENKGQTKPCSICNTRRFFHDLN